MSKGGSSGPEVTQEDQENINTFNKQIQRFHEVEAELKAKERVKEDYEEASNELMLADEEEVKYVLGECFYHASPEEAEERIQAGLEAAQEDQEELEKELTLLRDNMADLKKVLYAKFGNSINLEE